MPPLPPQITERVPVGTRVHLSLDQFAESFGGFTFNIEFVTPVGVETRQCQVTGAVTEKGLEVVVVE